MIVAILIHIATSTLVAYFLSAIAGQLHAWIAVVSLIFGFLLAWQSRRVLDMGFEDLRWTNFAIGPRGWLERILFVFLGYAAFRHFAWMFYEYGGDVRTLSANNFGDLPLHINYIRQFAYGAHFPPVNPEFALEPLRYPLGVDLYSSLWEILGVPTASHIFVFGLVAMALSLVVLRSFGGWLAIGGFFLNGGLLGVELVGKTLPDAVENNLAWKNIFLTVFVTQRGVLFALPAGLILILFVRRSLQRFAETPPTKSQYVLYGLLWGSLALFHLHSFVAVSLITIGLAGIHGRVGVKLFMKLLVPAVPIGTFFVLYSTGFLRKSSVLHWQPGWMAEKTSFIEFSFLNFGVWPLFFLAIAGLLYFSRKRTEPQIIKELLFNWIIGFALFVLFLNLMLAPWAWDNIKVLIWPYLLLLMVSDKVLALLFSRFPLALVHFVLAFILLVPGGVRVLKSLRGTMGGVSIYSTAEVARTAGAVKDLPINSVFASSGAHNHPLTSLGRIRAVGYEGHLWSHGIDYSEKADKLKSLMTGSENWRQAALAIGATHLFWGPMERQVYGDLPERLKSALKNSSSVSGYEVYELPKN